MAILLSCRSLSKRYGTRTLFDGITTGISEGERLGLIGPNGAGKSTLLRVLANQEPADSGEISQRRDLRLVYLPQEDDFQNARTIDDVLMEAMASDTLEEYERAALRNIALKRAGFSDGAQEVQHLSGGGRKRLALTRALVRRPDLLLMDEPTNHLDMDGVLWLERFLAEAPFAYVVVSHDRYFLENVTNRIVELNRAYPEGFLSVQGNYSDYLLRKAELLEAQSHLQHTLEGKVKREVEWLRRGPQARTTKAAARIQTAHALIGDLSEVKDRNAQGKAVALDFTASGRKTRELMVAKDISKTLGDQILFSDLSLTLSPGTRLGLIGPNGSGKTTLLRTLLGELKPDAGAVRCAEGLRVVYFDQKRAPLEKQISLRQALAGDRDSVTFQGSSLHISAWARRFLFRPEQLDMPVGSLSGGEQARILLANLMLRPADLLILDEPTNDLDIPSLEVLEDALSEFPGAIVLVTHDRYLLDTVSTHLLALDGKNKAEFFADYAQWRSSQAQSARPEAAKNAGAPTATASPTAMRRLTTAEQRELSEMEGAILEAEAHAEACQTALSAPAVLSDHIRMTAALQALEAAQERVTRLFARWEELEARRGGK